MLLTRDEEFNVPIFTKKRSIGDDGWRVNQGQPGSIDYR